MINFSTQIPDCDFHSPAFLDLLLSSEASNCFTKTFSPQRNSDHVPVSVFIDFPLNSQQDAPFHRLAYDYSRADWDDLSDHLRGVPWENILKLSTSAAASDFFEQVQIGNDGYIANCKYQVRPHPFLWFSAPCAATIVQRNHFFCLYQQIKSSQSKGKFKHASNRFKRVLEAAKLAYGTKTNDSISSQKLGCRDFCRIANSDLNKGKSAIPALSNILEKVLPSASYKAKFVC